MQSSEQELIVLIVSINWVSIVSIDTIEVSSWE